jgi:hypothetical protein
MSFEVRKTTVYSVLVITALLVGMVSMVSADPPAPPPPDPPNSEPSSSWTGNTSIKGCYTNFDSASDTLEYCSEPYIQYKTKTIYFCDADGDGELDDGETAGDYENPEPSCNSGESYVQLRSETRQFATCGKEDGESDSYDETPETTNVDDSQWTCPGTKALSLRHEPGTLNPGIGLASSGYSDLNSMTYKSNSNMSYYFTAAIPACVNRIPMINLNVEMEDRNGNQATEKTGLYAAHMNLYYGPNGDQQGRLKEVELPEQQSFRKKYRTDAEVRSYRMWAWRQRFADSVSQQVDQQNLQLPENTDVSEVAQDYRDSGKSVDDLWLSTQFLYGAEAGEPQSQTQTITRRINTTCRVDVRSIGELDLEDYEDLQEFAEDNPERLKEVLGKEEGENYCSVSDEQELKDIWSVNQAGTTDRVFEEKDGTVSTKVLDNVTRNDLRIEIDVRVMNLTVNEGSSGYEAVFGGDSEGERKINTSEEFNKWSDFNGDVAAEYLRNHSEYWILEDDDEEFNLTLGTPVEVSGPVGEESTYNASFNADMTRYMTGSDFENMESEDFQDDVWQSLRGPVLDSDWAPNESLKPTDRFDSRYVWDVLDHEANGRFEGAMTLNTSIDQSDYKADVDIGLLQEQEARESWNWRALQDITMTELAKCMYNWEECMNNERSMSERSYNAREVFDAGYGPWEGSFTFSWSQDAAEQRAEELQEAIDQSYEYNRSIDATFDKYYDGARGYDQQDITPTNVYRRCDSDQGWTSASGEFYNDSQFLCPDSTETSADGSSTTQADTETAYTCKFQPASNLPDYVERAEEFEARQVNGDWYVCREMSPPKWHEDESPPEVFVTGEPENWTATVQTAQVSCQDDVATCDTDSYRMKTYDVGEQPAECPTDYSEYDIQSGEIEVGKHEYVCGAAKDEVGKASFSPQPVEFKVRNLNAQLIYPDERVVTSVDRDVFLFYEVTNRLDTSKSVRAQLTGVNATWVDSGGQSTDLLVQPGETRRLQIQVSPEEAGTKELTVLTEDLDVDYTIESSMPLQIQNTAETGEREVPGLQIIQLAMLTMLAGAVYLFW